MGSGLSSGLSFEAKVTPTEGALLKVYRGLLEVGELKPDPAQEEVVSALCALSDKLIKFQPKTPPDEGVLGWVDRLRQRLAPAEDLPPAPRGLYVWGDVGRGKSFLMDLFHQNLALPTKRRLHFHEFMREVHERLHAMRRQPKTNSHNFDPLQEIAKMLAKDCRVLCLDELEVQDIGDAMIVGKLFQSLFENGVVVITTSNRPPKDLYKDGLQREKFLPFIDLIYDRLDICHLAAAKDYRLGRLQGAKLYLTPLGREAEEALENLFVDLAGSARPHPDEVLVKGRVIPVPKAAGSVAFFDFKDLCAAALGSTDYMEIAARYQAIILANIPKMTEAHAAEARRFVTLVDIFYDHRVKLIVSASAAPEELYDGSKGGFEFQRTVSRLIEMQADDYLHAPHLP